MGSCRRRRHSKVVRKKKAACVVRKRPWLVEAAGVEPASRCGLATASTCVARLTSTATRTPPCGGHRRQLLGPEPPNGRVPSSQPVLHLALEATDVPQGPARDYSQSARPQA